jgi:hypothetical protein
LGLKGLVVVVVKFGKQFIYFEVKSQELKNGMFQPVTIQQEEGYKIGK